MENKRLYSLDVFRGFTVICMLLVDYPGSWDHHFAIFDHSKWNGFTPPDFIFPSFMFIMGIAMTFSIGNKLKKNMHRSKIYQGILFRSIMLFAFGYLVNVFFQYGPIQISTLRLMGVLQRFSIVYLLASLLYLHFDIKKLIFIGAGILILYAFLITCIPVPGFGMPNLSIYPGKVIPNLPAWIDMKVLGQKAWQWTIPFDPEGILGTLPSITTALIGMVTGLWLKSNRSVEKKTIGMFCFGLIFLISGMIWNPWLPINKSIWSSSFVIYAAGWSLMAFASIYWIADGMSNRNIAFILCRYFGVNALVSFLFFSFVMFLINRITVGNECLFDIFYKATFGSWFYPKFGSLLFSLFYLGLWTILFRYMDKRKIYIKV